MMTRLASEKADVLIEAMKWIREHRGKVTVIKLGGSLMEDKVAMMHLMTDLVFMETVGMKPVVVHGGGPAISQAAADAGIAPRFVQGRRYTDEATLGVVREVLAKKISQNIVDEIKFYGGAAKSLSPAFDTNALYGRKTTVKDDSGQEVDLGWVGEVTRVDVDKILECCDKRTIPIIPSYTRRGDGSRETASREQVDFRYRSERGSDRSKRSEFDDRLAHRRRGAQTARFRGDRRRDDSEDSIVS